MAVRTMDRVVAHDPFSDLTPIPAPGPRPRTCGVAVDFDVVVADAGVKNVVTGRALPSDRQARACEILRRIAYGFHEYASREIVGRARRDIARGGLDLRHVVYSPRDPRKG